MVNVDVKEIFVHGRMILKLILSCSVWSTGSDFTGLVYISLPGCYELGYVSFRWKVEPICLTVRMTCNKDSAVKRYLKYRKWRVYIQLKYRIRVCRLPQLFHWDILSSAVWRCLTGLLVSDVSRHPCSVIFKGGIVWEMNMKLLRCLKKEIT
jgi:hypothetical protein